MTAVDDALDRLDSVANFDWVPGTREEHQLVIADLATVRDELRLRKQIAFGYAKENSRLEAELQRLREGLRDIRDQTILPPYTQAVLERELDRMQEKARALLAADEVKP